MRVSAPPSNWPPRAAFSSLPRTACASLPPNTRKAVSRPRSAMTMKSSCTSRTPLSPAMASAIAEAVRTLVEEGPAAIEQLIEWGTAFDREGAELSFAREGAHSRNRILHAHGDSTGREIARTLRQQRAVRLRTSRSRASRPSPICC